VFRFGSVRVRFVVRIHRSSFGGPNREGSNPEPEPNDEAEDEPSRENAEA
jgi:hypothetical protein